ncbi:MAG: ABC transporter ATP-binding protein [Cyanobacteriota bacterium]
MPASFSKSIIAHILRFSIAGATPVGSLLRETSKQHWRLLLLNFSFILVLGISEAGLFATIYRTISLLFTADRNQITHHFGLSTGQSFLVLLLLIALLQCLASTSRAMAGMLSGKFAASCQGKILPDIHNYLLSLSTSCVSNFKIGDLSHQATMAPLTINTEIDERMRIVTESLLASVYFLVLVLISPWLLLMACLLGFGTYLTQGWLRPRIRQAAMAVEQQRRRVAAAITADLQVIRLIHTTGTQLDAHRRFIKEVNSIEAKLQKLSTLRSLLEPSVELLPVLAAVFLGILSWSLTGGRNELLIPGLATFVLALQRLNLRLAKLAVSFNTLTENQSRVELLNQMLMPNDKTFRRKGGKPFLSLRKEISFQDVCFRHPNRTQNTLSQICFTIPRGNMIALVGPSGAGKSTIADLLVGLIDPTFGKISIDETNLTSLDLDSWQHSLGVVSQDILMLHDTIAANIAFGCNASISFEAIRGAAVAANADCFISDLSDGYNTLIGEHGHRLSGGQRQRISLARAMLRDPDLLILDEATSALDSHAEAEVHAAIEAFSRGRTVLAIAHRLSSIRHADMIHVIDAGRIVESGTHNDLISSRGLYASLWSRQSQDAAIPQ